MNPKAVKKHICEQLAHGVPIQLILSPVAPLIETAYQEDGTPILKPDPAWVKPDLPDWNLVVQWLKDDEQFRGDYEHALKYGAAYLADEMLILKNKVIQDPKSATAYKTAMDMIKWATMIRDPKYSERTIQEIKNNVPQDAETVASKIKALREELGIAAVEAEVRVIDAPVENKRRSQKVLDNLARARSMRKYKKDGGDSC